mmetsp:Transcript_6742/g.18833  ORF Transcript_6742/g.18833 Transcript_6742/m.18833 type:complete len:451 (+) Transcript_6742:2-1354(+)
MNVARLLLASALVASHLSVVLARVFRFAASSNQGRPLKEQLPWYHSADEIHERLGQLASSCQGADLDVSQRSEINAANAAGEVVQLDVVHVRRRDASPSARAMLVFGEHARELISPESALHFLEALCGSGPEAQRASAVLDQVAFTIVPNANPLGRKLVEEGYYCKRTNEDGVDLNRNFGDAHRQSDSGDAAGDDQNPGPSGFSEPESRILKALVEEERPEVYVSVHSGAYLLGTPFGYTADSAPEHESDMLEMLRPISQKYCAGQCPYGNLARLIHYDSPGCDIDYVAESAGVPYAFTWEIYVGPKYRQRYIEEARMQDAPGGDSDGSDVDLSLLAKSRRRALLRARREAARAVAANPEAAMGIAGCLEQFNPATAEETRAVVERWTSAFLDLTGEVAARKAPKPTPPATGVASLASPPLGGAAAGAPGAAAASDVVGASGGIAAVVER